MLSVEGLHIRAAFFRLIREFFHAQDFLEVDTPVVHPVLLPEANIIPVTAERSFLQTSPELCMKRLLTLGCPRIFQICPCFREEERGTLHLEEFQMIEWYHLNKDYRQLMTDCEALLVFIQNGLNELFPEKCSQLALKNWKWMTVQDAFEQFAFVAPQKAIADGSFDELLVEKVEPNLGFDSPVILYDYPVELASLARVKEQDNSVAERFELYINGIELANGFSELTSADEQRLRFEQELKEIEKQGRGPDKMPEKFLQALEQLETAAGIALGLDRLLMLFMGKDHIFEVQSFSPEDL